MNKIVVHKGDITKIKVDAIVNAANKSLIPGGGVDGAIHRAGGPELTKECGSLGGCETGEAKISKGYNLPASYVIHTVGPVYGQEKGKERELLASCYEESLKLAEEYGLKSIAFPAISTGVFGYPKKEAFQVAIETVKYYLKTRGNYFSKIIFVVFTSEDERLCKEVLDRY